MTGRRAMPWWDRRQATLVSAAARRAGLNPTARLDGWLDIRTDDGKSVAQAQFSQSSGAVLRANGFTTDVTPTTSRSFRRDGTNYFTAREVTDAFCDWLRAGRPAEYDAREFLQERRHRDAMKALGITEQPDERPVAPVVDLASRRKKR